MDNLAALLAVLAMSVYLGGLALVLRRRGRKRPLVKEDDYAGGCLVVSLVTGVVVFTAAWLWLDKPLWIALLAGAGFAVLVGFQIAALLPPSKDGGE